MSVVCEAYNLIVKKETLRAKYPLGVDGYENDCPNQTYCHDEHLTRIVFMDFRDVRIFLSGLEAKGFVLFNERDTSEDVAVVSSAAGVLAECDWLEFEFRDDIARAWLSGFPEGELCTPPNWTPAPLFLMKKGDSGTTIKIPKGHDLNPGDSLYTGRTFDDDE